MTDRTWIRCGGCDARVQIPLDFTGIAVGWICFDCMFDDDGRQRAKAQALSDRDIRLKRLRTAKRALKILTTLGDAT